MRIQTCICTGMYLGTCTPWYELQRAAQPSCRTEQSNLLLQSGTSRLVAPGIQSDQPHLRRGGESVCAKAVLTWTNGGVCSYNSGLLSGEISFFSGSCCFFSLDISRELEYCVCPDHQDSRTSFKSTLTLRGPAKSTGGILQTERTKTAKQECQNGRSSGWLEDNSP